MKKAIYFILAVAICLSIAFGFNYFNKNEYVSISEVQTDASVLWNSKIAESANSKSITVVADEIVISEGDNGIYMNEDLGIMIPKDLISKMFNCDVNFYRENLLGIKRGSTEIKLKVDSNVVTINDEIKNMSSSFILNDGVYYVPLEAIITGFEYEYLWEPVSNTVNLTSKNPVETYLPSYYNYADKNKVPAVKDQGNLGTCWAFASLTAIECRLLPNENYVFSEDHMSLNKIFGLSQDKGGEYSMAIAYLASWKGPVLDSQDPYGDGVTVDALKAVKHIQEVQIIKSKDVTAIKKMVYQYGAVESSLYLSTETRFNGETGYYNIRNNAYCYTGDYKPNHDVVIIGWDDNYPKENFNADVAGDGAFLCRNSWGADFGNQGNFYISYYDTVLGTSNEIYTKIEPIDNYDNIYQSDLCGWVGQIGYSRDTAYFANVYTAKKAEKLEAVSFYATDKDTEYSIYVCTDFKDTSSLVVTEDPVATGKFAYAGYYTVDLNKTVDLEKGKKYAVIVKITTPDSKRPIAIEYISNEKTKKCSFK